MLVFALATWYIAVKVSDKSNIAKFKTLVAGLEQHSVVWTLVLIVVLMLVNWLLEVVKWQYLASKLERISFWQAFQSVFADLPGLFLLPIGLESMVDAFFFYSLNIGQKEPWRWALDYLHNWCSQALRDH